MGTTTSPRLLPARSSDGIPAAAYVSRTASRGLLPTRPPARRSRQRWSWMLRGYHGRFGVLLLSRRPVLSDAIRLRASPPTPNLPCSEHSETEMKEKKRKRTDDRTCTYERSSARTHVFRRLYFPRSRCIFVARKHGMAFGCKRRLRYHFLCFGNICRFVGACHPSEILQ